jgi:anthranilate synthase component 2
MIFVIDNYDSFTYNLVHFIGTMYDKILVKRNDETTVDDVVAMKPDAIIISPGPCTPQKAGISIELIKRAAGEIPLLGVCLGHQAIGVAFGAKVDKARSVMHGKTSLIKHNNSVLYKGIKSPFVAGRYHSLAILRETLPEELVVDAETDDGEIMGIHHKKHKIFGVQFHPESVLTPCGKRLLRNFLEIAAVIKNQE